MFKCDLSIKVEKPFAGVVAEERLRRAVELTLEAEGASSTLELGLVIADDNTVRELNRRYRGIDQTTDVLAFALFRPETDAEHFIIPPDDIVHLGEVIISYPQALKQADEQHHTVDRELALLVVHGVLHLLGYDHEHPDDEQRMRDMEARVLAAIDG